MNAPAAQTEPAMPPENQALQGESLQPDKTVADYVAQAGGTRKEADRRSMPGDAIVVPEDLTRTTWMKDLKDWSQIFYQFGLGAAAIKIIRD